MTSTSTAVAVTDHRPTKRRPAAATVIVNPADYVDIVGKSFVNHERQPLLTIGNRHWDRWRLGRLGVPHTVAASNLNRVLQQLGITSLSMLAAQLSDVGTFSGIGVTAYWVCLAILKEAGYEPATVHKADVTYGTVKARALKQERRDHPRRQRKRSRR